MVLPVLVSRSCCCSGCARDDDCWFILVEGMEIKATGCGMTGRTSSVLPLLSDPIEITDQLELP